MFYINLNSFYEFYSFINQNYITTSGNAITLLVYIVNWQKKKGKKSILEMPYLGLLYGFAHEVCRKCCVCVS